MHLPTRAIMALAALLFVPRTPIAVAGSGPMPEARSIASGTSSASAALVAAAGAAGLRPHVIELAMQAHARAVAAGQTTRSILTVIDYSLPSRERRLWVLDIDREQVLARELVAHGKNTGDDIARRFSNTPGSYQSSVGMFITGETYAGKHGLSLRLNGVDPTNSNAASRAIVMHGAEYVNDGIVAQLGRLGRSEGCPALSRAGAPRIISLIRGGTVVFSYYPGPELEQAL